MFAFHYHCDMLLEVAEGIQTVCICVGAMQLFFLFPISFPLKQRMQQLESVFFFFNFILVGPFKRVTHFEECTFYISISHRLHHRVSVSSASLPSLFRISGEKKAFAVSFSKDLCTVYRYI